MKYSKATSFGTFVTPIRYYNGKVYVLNDVARMEVGDRNFATDTINSKLVYFVKGDGDSGSALQGDGGPSGARSLKADSGDKGPIGSQGPSGKHGVEGSEGPPGKIGKMGPVGSKGGIGPHGEKVARETLVVLANVHKVVQVLLVQLVNKVNMGQKETGVQDLVGAKGDCGE